MVGSYMYRILQDPGKDFLPGLLAEFTPGLLTCYYYFLHRLCVKSFHVSSAIINPGYHIILLSYHPCFDSNSQTISRKYPGENIPIKSIYRLDLVRYIMRRCKTEKERRLFLFFFYSDPRQQWGKKKLQRHVKIVA